ncbi:hypothetical protein, partial [Spirosoma pomorum]
MRTFISLFLGWLRRLLTFLVGPSPTPPTPFIPSPPKWHRLLGNVLSVRQRAYLAMLFLGLLVPTVSQAQLGLPTSLQICPGQSTTIPLNLGALAGTGAITVNATTNSPTGLTATVNTNSGILIAASPTLAPGSYTLSVTATTPGVPPLIAGLVVGPVIVPITVPNVAPTLNNLAGSTLGTVLNVGSCTTGTLSYTVLSGTLTGTTGTAPQLTFVPALNGATLAVACTGGPCPATASTLVLPTVSLPSLLPTTLAPICTGQPLSFSVGIANIGSVLPSTITASVSGIANATVSALGANGLLNVNIPTVPSGTNTLTVSLSVAGAQVATVPISVTGIDAIVPATNLASAVVGTALTLGTCPVGNPLSYTLANGTIGTGNLTFAANLSGQSVTIACQGSPCPPATITLPTVSLPSLTQPVLAPICAGQPLSFSVGIANIGNNLPSLLTASVSGIANVTVSVLGANGLLNVNIPTVPSGTNTLTVSLSLAGVQVATVPISVTGIDAIVPATNLASAVVGTALTLGTCPVGNPLSYTLANGTIGTGNLTFAANLSGQSVTIACQGSPCPPATVVLPTVSLPSLTQPVLAPICTGQPLSFSVGIANIGNNLPSLLTASVSGIANATVSVLGANGLLNVNIPTVPSGTNTLTVSLSLAGVQVATVPISVTGIDAIVPATNLASAVVGTALTLGTCPVGNPLSYTLADGTIGTGNLTFAANLSGQSVTIACQGSPCPPATITLPTVSLPSLTQPVLAPICAGQPLSFSVGIANIGNNLPSLLTASVSGIANVTVSVLGANGLLNVNIPTVPSGTN